MPTVRRVVQRSGLLSTSVHPQSALIQHLGPFDLVVHVGAHLGEEWAYYRSNGAKVLVWIEADPTLAARLRQEVAARAGKGPQEYVVVCAASSTDGDTVRLFRYNNDGASNSLYEPTSLFKSTWRGLSLTGDHVEIDTMTLGTAIRNCGIRVSDFKKALLVIDVQGHELAVCKGAGSELLEQFSVVQCEVSTKPVYDGGSRADAVLMLLTAAGFELCSELPDLHGDIVLAKSAG